MMRSNRSTLRAATAAALIFAACAALACGGRRADVEVIEVGGREREYVLHVPEAQDPTTPRPLLLVLHGHGGKGPSTPRLTGMDAVADREGFLAAYPSGVGKSWADGRGVTEADRSGVDDVAFLTALVERIAKAHAVDRQRVYVVGISNGGFMTQRLLMQRPDVFRGGVVVIATLSARQLDKFKPTSPARFAMINGTEDPLVAYDGGKAGRDDDGISTDQTIALWRTTNGCADAPDDRETIDEVDDDTRVEILSWSSSCAHAPVRLIRVVGGGHTWPGGSQYLPRAVIGRVSRELDAQEQVWRFLSEPHTPRASEDGK